MENKDEARTPDSGAPVEAVVMRFDYHKFHDRATEIILSALYEYANPVDLFNSTAEEINGRAEKAIHNYRSDPMTHARVNSIVAMLSRCIDHCIGA